jgi:hypothetical protein
MSDKIRAQFWGSQLEGVMKEIAREAAICQVRLLDPGVIEAVLHDNPSVCGKDNPKAFKKLRDLLMMGFVVQGKAVERLGPMETEELVKTIRQHLSERLGGRLGGPGAAA